MKLSLKKYVHSDSGAVIVIAALMMPLIIGMGGVGVDLSLWLQQKRKLQTAADSASLAAAYEIANGRSEDDAEAAGLEEAVKNGYTDAASNNIEFTFTQNGVNTDVGVTINQRADMWFASSFLSEDVMLHTAAVSQVEGTDGPYCFLSLNTTADHAVSISGNVTIDAAQCGIADNSSSNSALYLNGNVFVNVGDVKIVGDYEVNGGSADFTYESMRTNASSTADPYSSLTPPTTSAPIYLNGITTSNGTSCTSGQQGQGTQTSANTTFSPGRYCGGITVTGNNSIVLNPGIYIMDGGDFRVSGGGSIRGENVTIILTNSGGSSYGTYGNFDVTGGKDMYFQAPTTGPYEGIAIFQDRDAPTNGNVNRLNGNAGMTLDGVFYSPTRPVNFGGTTKASAAPNSDTCSKIIGNTITFFGTPDIGNNCTGKNTKAIGAPNVSLIL